MPSGRLGVSRVERRRSSCGEPTPIVNRNVNSRWDSDDEEILVRQLQILLDLCKFYRRL